MSPTTVAGQRSRKASRSSGSDAPLALLPAMLTSTGPRVCGLAVPAELARAPSRCRPSGSGARAAGRADLAALQVADEVPGEARRAHQAAALAARSWARFSPTTVDAGLGEHARAPRAATYLIAARICTSRDRPRSRTCSRLARMRARVQPADQLRHAIPAWRPVTPRSRRWEKKSPASQIVHRPKSWTSVTPAACNRARGVALRSSVARRSPKRAWTSSPTS